MERHLQLMQSLPPLVSAMVGDVINDRIDQDTIELAKATSREDFKEYDFIRCVVAASPDYPPIELARKLIDEMVENMTLVS